MSEELHTLPLREALDTAGPAAVLRYVAAWVAHEAATNTVTQSFEELAGSVWAGGHEALYDLLRERNSYEMDGVRYPSNGLTKEEVRNGLAQLTSDELAPYGSVTEQFVARPLSFKELAAQYAAAEPGVVLAIVTNPQQAARYLERNTSASWGAGTKAGPGWVELARFAPEHYGAKRLVAVCTTEVAGPPSR